MRARRSAASHVLSVPSASSTGSGGSGASDRSRARSIARSAR